MADWEGIGIWFLTVQFVGLAVLPLSLRLFRNLPDKGYTLAKPLGILLSAYILWLGATFGILDNTRRTIIFLVIAIGLVCWWPAVTRRELITFWSNRRWIIASTEILFFIALVGWAMIRSFDPAIAATEKPMEFTYLNAILRSERFPPHDPWLSGHPISYYYFGYVMMAMLTRLASIPSSVSFNLSIALLFALTVGGSFSLAYNLARAFKEDRGAQNDVGDNSLGPIGCGLLAALFVAILGNLEGVVEILNSHGWLSLEAWRWLQIKDLPRPYISASWLPSDWLWWWRASRVIGTFDPVSGISYDYTINESPFFSFLLGDLHPHVLSLPFTLMGISLAFNLYRSRGEVTLAGLCHQSLALFLIALCLGGLAFLNTWDLPTYLFLITLSFVALQYRQQRRFDRTLVKNSLIFGAILLLLSIVLYTLFYFTFQSQASGIGIVGIHTKLRHFLLFWGPLLLPALSFLVINWCQRLFGLAKSEEMGIKRGMTLSTLGHSPLESRSILFWGSTALIVLLLILLGAPVLGVIYPLLIGTINLTIRLWNTRQSDPSTGITPLGNVDGQVVIRPMGNGPDEGGRSLPATGFVLLMLGTGMLLIFGCELLFVRDLFGNRMNTVFKLYYQSWLLLAIVAAFALYQLSTLIHISLHLAKRLAVLLLLALNLIVLMAGFVYPLAATISKSNGFLGHPTLDGLSYLAQTQPEEYQAITWLNDHISGAPVILEAAGPSFSLYARVSANTGLPTVLGWEFHEAQWRGSLAEVTSRKSDVETIYRTMDQALAKTLLKKYNVKYVYVGQLERQTYASAGPRALEKFDAFMDIVYKNPAVTIYHVKDDHE
ncbi:MAG: DUF2298 domain-containing protein [Chloroflexi bacterium]|nr:DUF2298 domain-containing protein [Chloroflexota bacterium]MCL5075556.1 DUF2298 domain-containing protein [Chloroflexota bacterium]